MQIITYSQIQTFTLSIKQTFHSLKILSTNHSCSSPIPYGHIKISFIETSSSTQGHNRNRCRLQNRLPLGHPGSTHPCRGQYYGMQDRVIRAHLLIVRVFNLVTQFVFPPVAHSFDANQTLLDQPKETTDTHLLHQHGHHEIAPLIPCLLKELQNLNIQFTNAKRALARPRH